MNICTPTITTPRKTVYREPETTPEKDSLAGVNTQSSGFRPCAVGGITTFSGHYIHNEYQLLMSHNQM